VFRYKDPFNYWTLQAAREVASWRLAKVIGGKSITVANTGLSPTEPGTLVGITTRTDGVIGISFNGKLKSTFTDRELADKTVVGIVAAGVRAQSASFSNFDVSGTLPPPA
jgi:hypothetical protein